jgi:hypothetical protein
MTTVEVLEQVVSVIELTETEIVLQTVETVNIVEVGIAGPQGATGAQGPAGGTVLVDELADRPVSATEGDLFAARDTEDLYIWFGA